MTRAAVILLVDDEISIQRAVQPLLRSRGYDVQVAGTAREATDAFAKYRPDLLILDLGLPDADGLDVCRWVRSRSEIPILILSAREAERDKVRALDEGADDFVTKPFGPEELLARVRSALRRVFRPEDPGTGRVEVGDLVIDFDRRRLIRGSDEIRLTPKEFDLLSVLARNAGRVMTHRALLKAVWGAAHVDQPEHLWVLIRQLRKKVELDPGNPRYIQSEPWIGYRFGA
ncbi:MAG: response regulator transcription factor [Chloroflexota bacterium]